MSTYQDILNRTIKDDRPGYSYLETFANALYSHRKELNIGNVLLYLKLEVNNSYSENFYFVDCRQFNTDMFKLTAIASQNRVVDSFVDDMAPFKSTNELNNFHIIAFPVHPATKREILFGIKGVILLLSQTKINLSSCEQEQLYRALCSKKPMTYECPQVDKAIRLLVSTPGRMNDISLKDRHIILVQALDILANKGFEQNNFYGLKFFSFWSSNDKQKRYLFKEFDKYTQRDYRHGETTKVHEGQSHFISGYLRFYKEHEDQPFENLIKLFKFDDIVNSFESDNVFFPREGLTKDNISLIVIPLKFDPHISFCCFYIKDICLTPFVSFSIFKTISEAIRQRLNLINEINIKNMLDEMMAASFKFSRSLDFFKEISAILKKSNEAKDCLIYLKNDSDTRFLLVSEEDENNTSTIHESNEQYGDYEFYLPKVLKSNSFVRNSIYQALQTQTSACFYPEKDNLFTSMCVIIIKDADNSLCGFIILLNKYHLSSASGLVFNELFFFNNIYIVESCSKYLLLYLNFLHSNNRKINLLKKLRHEIPDCTHVIEKNIAEMSGAINNQAYLVETFQEKAREILISSRRIDNIASFFSTIDFDENRFRDFPHQLNMHSFMNGYLDLFREEAAYRGVSVNCDIDTATPILEVSDYYRHAIVNIITNAIRYASPGTCIWIRSNSEEISISDIGIQIKDSEMDKIFREGYRSEFAKNINERGMGYGLYLVKRILDAYGHTISVTCEKVNVRNIFAERMVSQIISEFSPEERMKYVLFETFPQEEPEVWRRVNSIKKSDSRILPKYRSFINLDENSISWWFDYHRKHGPSFFVMEDDYFNQPVYLVTFTIKFPK